MSGLINFFVAVVVVLLFKIDYFLRCVYTWATVLTFLNGALL